MKNRKLVITSIILLVIVIFFLIGFLIANITGKTNIKGGVLNSAKHSETIAFDKTYNVENIRDITINQEIGDIIIKQSESNDIKVVVYGDDNEKFNVNENDNNLEIDYTSKKQFYFTFFGFSFNNTKNDIIIYLPASYDGNIKLNSDYGECNIADLENANLNLKCNYGDVKLRKSKEYHA